ncbi:MAG: DnaJ C-terminal domain-containing protein, partial [Candidatus Saccharibacteria bacterium]
AGVGGASGGPSGAGGYDFNNVGGFQGQNINFDFGDMGLGDIFGSFFGGSQKKQRTRRGRDIETVIDLSFEEAVFGVEKILKLNVEAECEHCKGKGAEPGYELKTCPTCKGSGQVVTAMRTIFGNINQAQVCPSCGGQGKVPEKACTVCGGQGIKRKEQKVELKIPAGIDDGATIRLREHGEAILNGPKGDLYVHIRVKPHKKFTREGDLILSHETVDMITAALGGDLKVETVDGMVTMKVPSGTQSGSDFKLSSHGVPHLKSEHRGAHIVTLDVETPKKLSKRQKELLEEFKKDSGKWNFFS